MKQKKLRPSVGELLKKLSRAPMASAKQKVESRYSHLRLTEVILALDERLRRRQAIVEYSPHPACIFRLRIAQSRRALTLRDGTRIGVGQRMVQLHFWNAHIPPVSQNGATIAWARQMQKSISTSLCELVRYLASQPNLRDVSVIYANVPSATEAQWQQIEHIMGYYGFETIMEFGRLPLRDWARRLGENILISLTVFAQNAVALRVDTLVRVRVPIYLSRRGLEQRFGAVSETSPEKS